ncbi:MAG: 8-oxo-dGTP diphosphatase [Actinomycetota bacterium]|nr:8-oxo-dGTP diphosphatase [Actinomycetota bacterium]
MALARNAALAVHLVVLTVLDDELVALVLADDPNRVRLPGGPVLDDDDLLGAAERRLSDLTGLESTQVHVEQLATYGVPRRLTVAYLAVIPGVAAEAITATDDDPHTAADPPDDDDDHYAGGDGDEPEDTDGRDEADDAEWLPVDELLDNPDCLALDHHQILEDGVERARGKLEYSTLGTAFCPDEFTIGDLRRVYQAVWDTSLDPRNFHRKVSSTADFLVETGRITSGESGRPARLFRRGEVDRLHPALLRPPD